MEAGGEILREPPSLLVVREPPAGEDREVAPRNDVRAESRPPQLDERGVLPRGRTRDLHASMDRERRRAGHAVLQAGPCRLPERFRAGQQPLVERLDIPSVGEDLRPREIEATLRHVRGCSHRDNRLEH